MTTPQPYGAPGAPAQTDKTNVLAIVGIILAFFVPLVGVILGFVARSQIKRTGEKGSGLALAAIIIGLAIIVIYVIGVIVFSVAAANSGMTTTY
ncbi:DUF4190 domain-containing protein [Frigoribacterium sp. CFBP 8754]|uniref:DUF4190 domain-containing protein n=1 Tax=unclassified Frigoribacterium TaxID=2627005 RepID=UPI0016264CD7|nr:MULTISPECIES: DUF4190 domain-containing protein [unclassified Frigoribacterium]MBD8658660.1 DUF4190 domain-containing protein [Frigoribacterium sp. CFBP 8754]QNE44510.1 DUF4190 domain-containing protein [Frigoribacterium sp. NBH87]